VAPDTILCDLDGVVWLAGRPIPGSVEAVARLRAAGRRVVFVTNNSGQTLAQHTASLATIGIDSDGDVVSSATAASTLLAEGERVLVCGGAGVHEAVEQAGAAPVDGDDDAGVAAGVDAVVVGLHETFDYHRLRLAVTAVRAGARFVACNRDPLFPTPEGPVPGAGSIVAAVAASSGVEPTVAGKPYRPAAAAIARLVGTTLDDPQLGRRLVVVGDSLDTDGAFAALLGCPFALVRTGNTVAGAALPVTPTFDEADLGALASKVLASS
jgi:4-nitrophenyl phosphatase